MDSTWFQLKPQASFLSRLGIRAGAIVTSQIYIISEIPDTEVTDFETKSANLILFGIEDTYSVIAKGFFARDWKVPFEAALKMQAFGAAALPDTLP